MKVTVWHAVWAGEIIGPYNFKNDVGQNGTLNGDCKKQWTLTFFNQLNGINLEES